MSGLLERRDHDSRAIEWRRLMVLVVVVLALSLVWHWVRPPLVRSIGALSMGCWGREEVVFAALRLAGYSVKRRKFAADSRPRPGWCAWSDTHVDARGWPWPYTTFVDGHLRLLGKLPAGDWTVPPRDLDGDGYWEIPVTVGTTSSRPYGASGSDYNYYAVLRMRPADNELIMLAYVANLRRWSTNTIEVGPAWKDRDGDGAVEFVLWRSWLQTMPTPTAPGPPSIAQNENVAVFKVERPGGLMRLLSVAPGFPITLWDPPEAPVILPQDADLQAVFRELLPIPWTPEPVYID